eukprot:XP_001703669.1 predicted protein [Chlamydomonas reinhardtii]
MLPVSAACNALFLHRTGLTSKAQNTSCAVGLAQMRHTPRPHVRRALLAAAAAPGLLAAGSAQDLVLLLVGVAHWVPARGWAAAAGAGSGSSGGVSSQLLPLPLRPVPGQPSAPSATPQSPPAADDSDADGDGPWDAHYAAGHPSIPAIDSDSSANPGERLPARLFAEGLYGLALLAPALQSPLLAAVHVRALLAASRCRLPHSYLDQMDVLLVLLVWALMC